MKQVTLTKKELGVVTCLMSHGTFQQYRMLMAVNPILDSIMYVVRYGDNREAFNTFAEALARYSELTGIIFTIEQE